MIDSITVADRSYDFDGTTTVRYDGRVLIPPYNELRPEMLERFRQGVERLAQQCFEDRVSDEPSSSGPFVPDELRDSVLKAARRVLPAGVEPRVYCDTPSPGNVDIFVRTVNRVGAFDTPGGKWQNERLTLQMAVDVMPGHEASVYQVDEVCRRLKHRLLTKIHESRAQMMKEQLEALKDQWLKMFPGVQDLQVEHKLRTPEEHKKLLEGRNARLQISDRHGDKATVGPGGKVKDIQTAAMIDPYPIDLELTPTEPVPKTPTAPYKEVSQRKSLCRYNGKPVGLDGRADYTLNVPYKASEVQREAAHKQLRLQATSAIKNGLTAWPTCGNGGLVEVCWMQTASGVFVATWRCTCS